MSSPFSNIAFDSICCGVRLIPFTPFHFGPGVLVKACSPGGFWLTSFVVANVLIDVEVLYYLRNYDPPIHRHLHTYLGGTAMGLLAGLLMFGVVQIAVRCRPAGWRWVRQMASTTIRRQLCESVIAGVTGGVTHIFLDSLMHDDMHPFWPFFEGNTLAGVVGVGALHIGLGLTGFFGIVIWFLTPEK